MKPFPKLKDYMPPDPVSRITIAECGHSYERARADWYASEVVPLLKALRNDINVADVGDWNLIDRIDAVLAELENKT